MRNNLHGSFHEQGRVEEVYQNISPIKLVREKGSLAQIAKFAIYLAIVVVASMIVNAFLFGCARADTVTVTAYSQHSETASGSRPGVGTIAVSRDLLKELPFGSLIHVDDMGLFEVCDVMHPRKCKSLDVYVKTEKEAKHFGVKKKKIVVVHRAKKSKSDAIRTTGDIAVQKGRKDEVAPWSGPLPQNLFDKRRLLR